MGNLRKISSAEKFAALKAELDSELAAAMEKIDGKIAGYALVVWDQRGEFSVAYSCETGPIGSGRLPEFVKEAVFWGTTQASGEDE